MKSTARYSLYVLMLLLTSTGLSQAQTEIVSIVTQEERQEQLREKAEQAGKAIEVTLKLEADVITIPRDAAKTLREFRAAQREVGKWLGAWRQLEQVELQRRIRENDGPTKFMCLTMAGQVVSREQAIEELGPPPKLNAKTPQSTKTPGGFLELKNTSNETKKIYLNWANGNGALTYVSGKNLKGGWRFTAGHLNVTMEADAPTSIELAPGETYQVDVIPVGSIDNFREPGEFEVTVSITSGLTYDDGSGERLLTDEAMVLASKPVAIRVEYE